MRIRCAPFVLLLLAVLPVGGAATACTIGVAHGDATGDGRPLLWKNRDNAVSRDNQVIWDTNLILPFVALVTGDGDPAADPWMGVNRHGFALVNATADDLERDADKSNGEFMRWALGTCRSVDEFLDLLDATDGARDTHGNFAVIDTTGAAMMVEASAYDHWTYDAADAPDGFVVRTNFACRDTVGTGIDGRDGAERFARSQALVSSWAERGELDLATLIGRHARDLADPDGMAIPVPCFSCDAGGGRQGFCDATHSIGNGNTVSAVVIQGVAPAVGEAAWLTTMWVQLGQPACTVAVPYWPVGPTPTAAGGTPTAPLCDAADALRGEHVFPVPFRRYLLDTVALRDGLGGGLWGTLLPAEAAIREAALERLDRWRVAPPIHTTVLACEDSLATAALAVLQRAVLPPPPDATIPIAAFPSPCTGETTLVFDLPRDGHTRLDVLDLAGRRVARLVDGPLAAGLQRVTWNAGGAAGGCYLVRVEAAGVTGTVRVVVVR